MILLYFLLLVAGFFGLVKGADIFVDGSSAAAKKLRVPPMVIGLTVVSMGTSLPELAVSITAARTGSNEIALSNVLGSNIFNVLAILGFCALFCAIPVKKISLVRDFPVVAGVPMIIALMVGGGLIRSGRIFDMDSSQEVGAVGGATAAFLVVGFVLYILALIFDAKKHPENAPSETATMPNIRCIVFIVGGAVLIIAGGQAVVHSAKWIAAAAGMTETLIGLTVVALGTSLPELVTSVVAARKGEVDLAVGNVLGSDIFNFLMVLGISSVIDPITVNVASLYDLVILVLATLLVFIFSATRKVLVRFEGVIMLIVYASYVVYAAIR